MPFLRTFAETCKQNRMKPALTYYALLVLLLAFCFSCKTDSEKKKYVIGVSQCTLEGSWRKSMLLDMKVQASEYPDVSLLVEDAADSSLLQVEQIRSLIKRKVDLLIISANESEPVTPIAIEAYRAGIPTILVDRKISSDEYTTYIGGNNYEIGRQAAFFVNRQVKEKYPTVLEVWGLSGSSPAQDRHRGFMDVLNSRTKVKEIYGKWKPETVEKEIAKMDSLEEVDVVFAHNDVMAMAARRAIEKKHPGLADQIRFVGIDAVSGRGSGLEAVMHGELAASILYPTGGSLAIRVAMQILNGEDVSRQYLLSSALIDKNNAGTLFIQSEQVVDYQHQIELQRENLESMLSKYTFLQSSVSIILLLMGLLLLSALYVIHVNRTVKRKNRELKRTNLQVQQQKEELAEANRYIEKSTAQKLQFFTNITHEIKTPLTLILGPLGKLSKEAPEGSSLADDIRIIRKNAERLKRVVDQLLDFRKVESNKMNMRVGEVDLVAFVAEVKSCFDTMAAAKQIHFTFEHDCPSVSIWVDRDKMEKILANLLSNAFKFTLDGGTITVRLKDKGDQVELSVEDNGKGIPLENIASVFDRFFTGDQNYVTGTGIGLHLTREFVHMHKGTIRVESVPHKSTVFTVVLLKGKSHFDESCTFDLSVTELSSGVANLNTDELQEALDRTYDYTVLVVEDDPDIQGYLQAELKQNFHVLVADNGVKALEVLMSEEVSVVVSDVMMPEMNGFDLCRKIKSDIVLSHLPVMLLTALSDDKQQMYGAASGADAYIQKPFNIEVVKLRIIKLLEDRARLREAYARDASSPAVSVKEEKAESMDDLFMNRFLKLIEESYADPDFSIEKGSEKLGLSRVHLYRKVKELAGVTPTDFLRNYRLKKAAALLRRKAGNVNEVAYATGFGSPAYFSKCFKAVYNITPTEYLEKE